MRTGLGPWGGQQPGWCYFRHRWGPSAGRLSRGPPSRLSASRLAQRAFEAPPSSQRARARQMWAVRPAAWRAGPASPAAGPTHPFSHVPRVHSSRNNTEPCRPKISRHDTPRDPDNCHYSRSRCAHLRPLQAAAPSPHSRGPAVHLRADPRPVLSPAERRLLCGDAWWSPVPPATLPLSMEAKTEA